MDRMCFKRKKTCSVYSAVDSGRIGAAGDIVKAHIVVFGKTNKQAQGDLPLAALIFGIERLIAKQQIGDLLLGQVVILSQIAYAQFQNNHLEYSLTNIYWHLTK